MRKDCTYWKKSRHGLAPTPQCESVLDIDIDSDISTIAMDLDL